MTYSFEAVYISAIKSAIKLIKQNDILYFSDYVDYCLKNNEEYLLKILYETDELKESLAPIVVEYIKARRQKTIDEVD